MKAARAYDGKGLTGYREGDRLKATKQRVTTERAMETFRIPGMSARTMENYLSRGDY